MTSDQIQEVIQYLINLGETMATGAYQLALKRTVFLGISNLLWAVVVVAIFVMAIRSWRKGQAMQKENKYSDYEGYWVLGLLGIIFAPIIFGYLVTSALDLFLNPEWNAIKMILNFGQ